MAQDAYVTMLFSDGYLQGAQVLAASLRDGGTTKKLAVIVPADEAHRLLPQTMTQLEESFDFVLPMPTLATANFANLQLLDRPDLALTLTKINLWRLTQFRKCVYLDADVLALRAPDELFDLDVDFAAAPDVGWPDIFNSGVFLFKPSMGTYYALKTLAESGITFDGGDQGLLNTFFPAYHRLSFTYNVTPSTNYQYTPAYRHFASNISLFHFIGKTKPWSHRSYTGSGAPNEASGRWWGVYEKHFGWKIREEELRRSQERAIHRTRDSTDRPPVQSTYPQSSQSTYPQPSQSTYPQSSQSTYPQSSHSTPTTSRPSTADKVKKQVSFGGTDTTFFHPSAPAPEMSSLPPSYHAPPPREPSPVPFEPKMVTWDPARSAPPPDSEPEGKNLSISAYESVWDKPFNPEEPKWVPPPRQPLPKGLDYIPPAPSVESHDTSSDSEDEELNTITSGSGSEYWEDPTTRTERYSAVFPWETSPKRPIATRVFPGDEAVKDKGPILEGRPYDRRASLEKYEFTNAWDSLPIMQSYVKQKLGEPAPITAEEKPEVESPSTPTGSVTKGILATSKVTGAIEGERWDPNKAVDELRSGVITKLKEQSKRSPIASHTTPATTAIEKPPVKITVDEGTNP